MIAVAPAHALAHLSGAVGYILPDVAVEIADPSGKALPAGKYSLWVIPQESDAWTVIFNRSADAFHLSYDESQDALRVQARATTSTQSVETLQLSFPVVDADSAVMQLQWGTVVLPLHLRAK